MLAGRANPGIRAVLRRRFLQGLVASGCAIAGAGGAFGPRSAAAAQPRTPVRLGFLGNTCEAATFLAPRSEFFARNDLRASLVDFGSEAALIAALDAGRVDAASVSLPALLEPLENGSRIRIAAGLHAGCLRVLAQDAIELETFGSLKGKVVATDRLHGASMNLLSAILFRQGIDPRRDLTWQVYASAALEAALDAKAVSCVATSDPLGYHLLTAHKAELYLSTAGGGFSCGGDIAPGHHCFLVLAGKLVEQRPAVAAAVTRAYLGTTAAIGRGVGPAALAEASSPIAADVYRTLGMLASYDWSASTDFVIAELELTARDFRRAGLLHPSTDPEALAAHAFADVLHA
jgi:NitT/TauT family transport system substrate-binding protein